MSKIVAYFSHSYRPEDRAINMAVWRPLNECDVVFAVDPPSRDKQPMDVTFLERMMQRSNCFVAVVPLRPREPGDGKGLASTWSPYQEFEYRLAVRANKPRLIVLEEQSDSGPLSDGEPHLVFQRSSLEVPDFKERMEQLLQASRAPAQRGTLPKIGVLRWGRAPEPAWETLSDALKAASPATIAPLDVDGRTADHELLKLARNVSIVVADINPRITPPHVLGLLHGAAIPLFRTCLLATNEDEASKSLELGLAYGSMPTKAPGPVELRPLLLTGYRVDPRMRPLHFWTESSAAATALDIATIVNRYRDRERELETKSSGREYFLGLRGNRVFISTSGELKGLTIPVKRALDDAGLPAFHYQDPGPHDELPLAEDWRAGLCRAINDADMLLAFVSPNYWRSPNCVAELETAIARWERHQLLIVTCLSEAAPPLPEFMGRYQAKRFNPSAKDLPDIVEAVRGRFSKDRREEVASFAGVLEALVRRQQWQIDEAFLKSTCGLSDGDAADVMKRLAPAVDRDAELVGILVDGVQVERFGPAPLGRLCLRLRRLESRHETRETLTDQFSLLRLFPALHDVAAWLSRRGRLEVELTLSPKAPKRALEIVAALAGDDNKKKIDAVQSMGDEVAGFVELDSDRVSDERSRIAARCAIDDLMIPFEWAVVRPLDGPLGRARPIYRRLSEGAPNRRAALEDLFDAAKAGPPRALLVGYSRDLPHVEDELNAIRQVLEKRYTERNWPPELIEVVRPGEATLADLKDRLSNSDYEILHVAGHGGWDGGEPALQDRGPERVAAIRGEDLRLWLKDSDVRFAYLSCCFGAAQPVAGSRPPGWRQTLCRAVLEGGVPEVVAHYWPVSDARSVAFARVFYESFVRAFDAPKALYDARLSLTLNDPLWAAAILVKQPPPNRGKP